MASVLNEITATPLGNTIMTVGGLFMFLALVALAVTTLYSYKLFKLEMTVACLIFGFNVGNSALPSLLSLFVDELPDAIYMPYLLGIICAIVFGVLINVLYKFVVFATGAILGATVGFFVVPMMATNIEFLSSQIGYWAAVAVFAIIAGVIVLFIFRPFYIVVTSLVGGAGVGALLSIMLMPKESAISIVIFLFGIIFGIVGMIYQLKTTKGK